MFNSPFIAAFIASMLHVLSGPDHLAAVTPLAITSNKKSWLIGFLWGFGHISGMLFIGILFYFFKDLIPIEKISAYSEQLVAFVLIAVGLFSLFRIFKEKKKKNQPHFHKDEIHIHKLNDTAHNHNNIKKQNFLSSFGIGLLHGLAGVAHFFMLLPILSFSSNYRSFLYLMGFAFGTITAMTSYALIIGKISDLGNQSNNAIMIQGIRLAGGLFALIIGFYWLYLTI